ncbi:pogo transposable element derived with KRAB domain [Phyllostomus discolor]|uniref:Pogo transposable element derived with KRAB domain n=1 Tax=Phyllostomus discolor TaxID=89673 RepID=A0A834D9P0_9CHIR|nr:pogo transposable element derived with KRAB domain [Phyllostomus discolor]
MEPAAFPLHLALKVEEGEEEAQSPELEGGPTDTQKVRICSESAWNTRKRTSSLRTGPAPCTPRPRSRHRRRHSPWTASASACPGTSPTCPSGARGTPSTWPWASRGTTSRPTTWPPGSSSAGACAAATTRASS